MNKTFTDTAFATLQALLPKHALSRAIHWLMRVRTAWLRALLIKGFLRCYRVAMDEALHSDPLHYESFNAFFTRALRPHVRPMCTDPQAIVSPVDGTISQCGVILDDQLIQAKGHHYSLLELLAGDSARAACYRGGHYACIYLAPFNYHRIHMPATATVRNTIYVPGDLFSVNSATARSVPNLFARNERVICDFSSAHGSFAMILVGALFVGSIETVWAHEINPPPRRRGALLSLTQGQDLTLNKGDEMGRFNMGSTVIVLFQPNSMQWEPSLTSGASIRLGQQIGTFTRSF